MASGAVMRYRIAEFRPAAGFSPNWEAVLVQIEHWAKPGTVKNKQINATQISIRILMDCILIAAVEFG